MWGTRKIRPVQKLLLRFIPTHVGNASGGVSELGFKSVHPHACGERSSFNALRNYGHGSSPRMWGTHQNKRAISIYNRFIPTHVGNAFNCIARAECDAVHPHACGERTFVESIPNIRSGSSPRMWGTHEIMLKGGV